MKHLPQMYIALFFSFLLGIHRGFVALWTSDNPYPAVVFPYSASSLPEPDRQALEIGISIDSRVQLEKLLEDYLS